MDVLQAVAAVISIILLGVAAAFLSLAEDLASDRDEASKALTRAMFLTTGHRDEPRS